MKKLFTILVGICLLTIITYTAYAGCSSPDGKTYTLNGCSVTFIRGPFGPGESGIVTVNCFDDKYFAPYDYYVCSQDKCSIVIMQDGNTLLYLYQVGDNMLMLDYPPLLGQ